MPVVLRTEHVTRAVFWSGLAGGAATAIPLVNLANCFCCLWAWATGALALAMVRPHQPLRGGEVPGLGALAGLYAALVALTLGALRQLLFGAGDASDLVALRDMFPESMPAGGLDLVGSLPGGGPARVAMLLLTGMVQAAFFAGFGALGALLFDRLFPTRQGPQSADPSPVYPGGNGTDAADGAA